MKRFLFCLLLSAQYAIAQEYKPLKSFAYGGFGTFQPSSAMKKASMIKNGINFRVGYFHSLAKLNASGSSALGVEIRFDYSKFAADLSLPAAPFHYEQGQGKTGIPVPKLMHEKKKPDAYHYLFGPSLYFEKKKTFIQPSVLVGYASVSQEPFRFEDSVILLDDRSQDKLIVFYNGGHETNNGWAVVPGVKAGYRFTKSLAFAISADYTFGSSQQFEDRIYEPSGTPNASGNYPFSSVANGISKPYYRETKLRALFLTAQLAVSF